MATRVTLISKGTKGQYVGMVTYRVTHNGRRVGQVYRMRAGQVGAGRWGYSTRIDGNMTIRVPRAFGKRDAIKAILRAVSR